MKIRLTKVEDCMMPSDMKGMVEASGMIKEGAVLDAHYPNKEELLSLGVAEEDVGILLVMLTLNQAVVLENIPGFEADPMIVCSDCYEIVE
nr:MAG TPA: hypothetical protein [Caudoviricetes sp.]